MVFKSLCFLQLKKTPHDFFSSNLVKLDPMDPDPPVCWIQNYLFRIRIRIQLRISLVPDPDPDPDPTYIN